MAKTPVAASRLTSLLTALRISAFGGRNETRVACASVPECPLRGTREILSCVNVEMHLARVVRVGLSLLVLTALGGTAASSTPALPLLPPPSFQPARDQWLTVTTGPTRHKFTANPPRAIGIAPQVWAITVRHSDLSALQPYSLGTGLLRLRRNAVLIEATTSGRGSSTAAYTPARWPLRLRSFQVNHRWETQPAPNIQERLRWAAVDGWRLDVRVYFATQHPSKGLLSLVQAELNRMRLP